MLTVNALAAEGGFDLSNVMSTAVSQVQGDLFSVLGIVVPAMIAVIAAVVGVKFGSKWLKSLGK